VPLSTFIEISLREHSAIAARSNASWRFLALLLMLPFGVDERGLSLTWHLVGVGVEMMGAGGGAAGGVAGRGGGVAGFAVGEGWVWEDDGWAVGVESSFFHLSVRLFGLKTMFVRVIVLVMVVVVVIAMVVVMMIAIVIEAVIAIANAILCERL
jgi:hypothetical protein